MLLDGMQLRDFFFFNKKYVKKHLNFSLLLCSYKVSMKVGSPASDIWKYEKGDQRTKWDVLRSLFGYWNMAVCLWETRDVVITAGRRGIKLMSVHVLLQRAYGIPVKSPSICTGN